MGIVRLGGTHKVCRTKASEKKGRVKTFCQVKVAHILVTDLELSVMLPESKKGTYFLWWDLFHDGGGIYSMLQTVVGSGGRMCEVFGDLWGCGGAAELREMCASVHKKNSLVNRVSWV